jgi:signal transduction histidine kinase
VDETRAPLKVEPNDANGLLGHTSTHLSLVVTALVRDISARKRVEDERRLLLAKEQEARRDAETANRVKDEFLATLSHELRTPLTTILGWTQVLRLKAADAEYTRKAAGVIEKSARDQGQLIDDLLDVTRIQEVR